MGKAALAIGGCALAAAAGCGRVASQSSSDAAGEPPGPDGGHALMIELFNSPALLPGDTASADLVAVQDGDGAWAVMTGDHGVYQAQLTSDRYGVLVGCQTSTRSSITVIHQTAADGLDVRTVGCGQPASVELDFTVHGIPQGGAALLAARNTGTALLADGTTALMPQPGLTDVVASAAPASTAPPSKLVRVPAFDLQTKQSLDINFTTQGVAPESHPLSVTPAPGEITAVDTHLRARTGSYPLGFSTPSTTPPATFQILPAALRQPDDLFEVTLSASIGNSSRSTTIVSKAPQTLAFQLPPALTAPAPAVLSTPYLRLAFSLSSDGRPIASYNLTGAATRSSDGVRHLWSATLSSAWLGPSTAIQYAFPDLSAIAGVATNFALFDRERISWTATRNEPSTSSSENQVSGQATITGSVGAYCGNGTVEPPETCDPPNGTTCSSTCMKL